MRQRANSYLYFIAGLVLALGFEPSPLWPLPTVMGQTATLLPDGSWLLLGGLGPAGPLDGAGISTTVSNEGVRLSGSLHFARAWHTATLLPDGTVLVLGGIGGDGRVIETAELFDPETKTSSLLTTMQPTARAFHTATLLTNGTVLVAGGLSSDGVVLRTAEIWNSQSKTLGTPGELSMPRHKHSATLLPNGKILLRGGIGQSDEFLHSGDLYDPDAKTFSPVDTLSIDSQAVGVGPALAASIPEDGAQNVGVGTWLALRFSKPLQVQTVNIVTATLQGPEGLVSAKVVPAEGGMLAFVTPQAPLLAGSAYVLSLNGLGDPQSRPLPFTQINFTTAAALPLDDEVWVPSGSWRTERPDSPWQKLTPLLASSGVTAIAGQVLKLTGEPLGKVTLQVGSASAQSDSTGRFLLILDGQISGHCVLVINGATANNPGKTYGLFEYGMTVKAGTTNVLPFTIWMPLLDMAHAVTIPVPTKTEILITTPLLPGLELDLPAGTVIYGLSGQAVNQISITPIPLDRTPFPLPNVPVPIYFTIQPGGAWLKILNPAGPTGARLIYPNTYNSPPGIPYQFWNYEADGQGWYIYGLGKVSPNRLNVIPDPGVTIYEFTGAMVGSAGAPPNGPPPRCGSASEPTPAYCGNDPIDLSTGLFVHTETDLTLPDVIPLTLTRTYRPNDPYPRAFGIGTNHPYDIFLYNENGQSQIFDLILSDGGRIHFVKSGSMFLCTSSPTIFYGATITAQSSGTTSVWVLKRKDGAVLTFPESVGASTPQQEALIAYQDRYGNVLALTRDSNSNLTRIASPNGRYIQFTLDTSGRITQATDNIGRLVKYAYDTGGRLSSVTDANGGLTTYTYDASNNMATLTDARRIERIVSNQYDSNNRLIMQTQADGSTYQISYTLDGFDNVIQATSKDPLGNVRQTTFNASNYALTDTLAVGTPQQELTTYNRDSSTNLVMSMTDPLNRTTAYAYDNLANLLSFTQLYGTPNEVTTSYTYDPIFSQITSITDPLHHVTSFTLNAFGNPITLTDPLHHQWTFTYNTQGEQLSATNPLKNTTTYNYIGGDLISVTDPLFRTTTFGRDGAGRLVSTTDPLGETTRYQYDALDDLTNITDPLGNVTSFVYDADRDMVTLTDALTHSTAFTYDVLDRLSTRTDPLHNSETYTYDLAGNPLTFTDRKGQKTSYMYDPLNREAQATYADTSFTAYTYDLGNRLIQEADTVGGTIARAYDGLDRLTSEVSAQGSVSYAYDNASRRTQMAVAGQPATNYAYDNANRLTKITHGGSPVILTYDNANRRKSSLLANGVTTSYSYDIASELTGLTYSLGATTAGNLTYTYDVASRRTSVGGTYAQTGLPQSVVSASYNADNQLLQWGSSSLTYDLDGNLTNDGVNAYAWNARNQLASINSGATAGFLYDGFGRRQTKTIGGTSTSFLYDGINPVQELSGTTVTANLLTSLSVDEYFSRSDSAGARYFLSDALGSTLALTDSTGALQTQYTYDPYGNTTRAGLASGNSYQYTGRENDNAGLYYYRARFYNSQTGRFISEDRLGVSRGRNLYQYVLNRPVSLRDPFGTQPSNGSTYTVVNPPSACNVFYSPPLPPPPPAPPTIGPNPNPYGCIGFGCQTSPQQQCEAEHPDIHCTITGQPIYDEPLEP